MGVELDSPLTLIIPVLVIVTVANGSLGILVSVVSFTAAIPIPPLWTISVPPSFFILFSVVVLESYVPRSPVAFSPTSKLPDEIKSPFEVAISVPEPSTMKLFPSIRVPPLLNTPIPPFKKLNVSFFSVVPKLAVPPSKYIPVPPSILRTVAPVVRTFPFFTYIPTPFLIAIFPLCVRVFTPEPDFVLSSKYIPTPFLASTFTLSNAYAPTAFTRIPTDVFPSFPPGEDGSLLFSVSIFTLSNVTVSSRRYTPIEPDPVFIFFDIAEFSPAATPIAPSPVTFTSKSILALFPYTPTPSDFISKFPVFICPASVPFKDIPTPPDVIVPPVPSKLFAVPSTYTPVPVVAVIVPAFLPELIPVPAIYIPRLAPTFISFDVAFSIVAIFPISALATIPTTVLSSTLAVPPIVIVPELTPLPSSTYIPILSLSFIVIFPFEVSVEFPPTYEPIFSDSPAVDVISALLIRFIPSPVYIPILLLPERDIAELFVTSPISVAVPLL